jgi:hypothetical protein
MSEDLGTEYARPHIKVKKSISDRAHIAGRLNPDLSPVIKSQVCKLEGKSATAFFSV